METKEKEKREPKGMNPFTDYGFKRLFNSEPNTDLVIDFINGVLRGERVVTEVRHINSEVLPSASEGKVVFIDVLCKEEDGTSFLVEMQRCLKPNLLQRLLFYGCRLLSEQKHRGENYNLQPVYVICLLDTNIKDNPNLRSDYSIVREPDGVKELNELRIILYQLKRFDKEVKECLTIDDKWLYLLSNLEFMERLPKELQNKIMEKVMTVSRIEAMSLEEREAYEKSMMEYDDIQAYRDFAKEEGRLEGKEEGKIEEQRRIAKSFKSKGTPISIISECTGLSEEEIGKL